MLSLPEDDPSNIRDKVFNELDLDTLEVDDGITVFLNYMDKQFGRDDLTVKHFLLVASRRKNSDMLV